MSKSQWRIRMLCGQNKDAMWAGPLPLEDPKNGEETQGS